MVGEELVNNAEPKFKVGKTYDARRGRKKYEIKDAVTDGKEPAYSIIEWSGRGKGPQDWTGRAWIPEKELLERASLKKKDRKRVWLSPSQMSTFLRCQRKWAYTYINGEVEPSTTAQEFGTDVHKVLEVYEKTGKWQGRADAVATAKQCCEVLPSPKNLTLGIEQPFQIPILDGKAVMMGFIDLMIPHAGPTDVIDYKTTKDLRYAKNSMDLKKDVQANIYAKWAIDKSKEDSIRARWIYLCARPSKAKTADADGRPRNVRGWREVERIKTRKEINEQFEGLLVDAAKMVKLSNDKETWAEHVECNPEACNDYGGCYFGPRKRAICKPPQMSLGAMIEQQNNSPFVHSTKKEEAQPMESLMDIINRNKTTEAAAPAKSALTQAQGGAGAAPAKSALQQAAEAALAARTERAVGINPPAIPPAELDPELAEIIKKPIPDIWKTRLAKGHKARTDDEKAWRAQQKPEEPQWMENQGPNAEQVVEPASAKEEREQRWREAKQEEAVATNLQPVRKDTRLAASKLTLFVDCFPAKGTNGDPLVTLAEVLRPMKNAVQEMKGVPFWNLLKYREGETLLAACVEQQFKVEGVPNGNVLVDSASGEWKACGDVLTELADVVIRGQV